MSIIRILEILLVIMIIRALFPVIAALFRGRRKGDGPPVERFKEEKFDRNKSEIEDGEFKELK